MTRYRHRSGACVEVITADAWEVPADALVFGRSQGLRLAVEAAAGKPFQPVPCWEVDRRVEAVVSDHLPWRQAYSYRYTPRRKGLESRHTLDLLSDLTGLLCCLDRQFSRPRRTLILPLSWRYPELHSMLTVAALWQFIQLRNNTRPAGEEAPWIFVLADRSDASVYEPILLNRNGCLGNQLKRWDLLDDWTRQDLFMPEKR